MPSNVCFSHSRVLKFLSKRTDRQYHVGLCLNPVLCVNLIMLSNIFNTLFGTGRKTEVHQQPVKINAEPEMDSKIETTKPALSIEEEIQVLAQHFGGISTGMTLEIELRELLELCPRNRRKADSYYQLKKHLKDDYGIELIITSRTSKSSREDEV